MTHPVQTESSPTLVIADPTPVGLICLAIGCAALVPIAFGASLTPSGGPWVRDTELKREGLR